jgi:type IV pilus assembly protein PilA
MQEKLSALRERRAQGEKGFTLIELLVVVVIIGILIAIAIPLYLNYKKGANDKGAQSDLRGAVSVLEQCSTDNGAYPTAVSSAGAMTGCDTGTITKSSGTTFTYFVSGSNYIIESTNSNGSKDTVFCYASAAGGSVAKANKTVVTTYAASCPA